MFTGWFYVCAGEVISWFLIWEQGVESSNLSVPISKTFRLESYSSLTLRTRQLIKIDSGIQ